MDHLRQFYRRHAAFLIVLALFVSFRVLALFTLRTGGFVADFSDYDFYATWGRLTHMGYRTFDNLWTAYPPLFAAIMLPVYELSARVPVWIEPRLWFHVLFGLTLLVFETGNLVLIYRLGAKLDRESVRGETGAYSPAGALSLSPTPGLTAALLYALLFVPAYTLLGWFEPMPLFFMLLGLDLLISPMRWGWIGSAVAAALGFLVKLTPMILVPIAVRWLGAKLSWRAVRDEWFKRDNPGNLLRPTVYVLLFVGIIVGLGYVLVGGRTELAFSSVTINNIRPPWQSIWAVLDGFYGYGLVPLDMRNLTKLDQPLWDSRLPWTWITLAFLALYLWLYTRRYDWSKLRTPVAFAGVSTIWLFLYSKGWSPQFLMWVLAFQVLLLPGLRGVAYAVMLSAINVIEAYVYLIMLPDAHWLMNGTVILRTLLLTLLAVEFLAQIWPHPARAAAMRRVAATAGWSALALTLTAALVAIPRAAQAYETRRFAELPCRDAVTFLRDQADDDADLILSQEIDLWQELYPWLRRDYTLRVLDTYSPYDAPAADELAAQLDELLGEDEVWWIERAPSEARATYFQRADVAVVQEATFGPCTLLRVARVDPAQSLAVADVAGGPIQLVDAQIGPAQGGADLHLVLYWRADAPVTASYTVFTQLFAPDGQMAAQQDNVPVTGLAPTDTWQPGTLIRDPYRLPVPPAAAPGSYVLHVGLYDDTGRAPLTLADGSRADHLEFSVPVAAP